MFDRFFGGPTHKLERAFEDAARHAPEGPLADYYRAGLADLDTPANGATLLAIDLETDGLDLGSSTILEAGCIALRRGMIASDSARRIRFRSDSPLDPEAVVIHRITDDAAAAARPFEEALAEVLRECAGKVLVAHFAEIEAGFLDAACRLVYGTGLVAPFICTMQLEARWFPRTRAADRLRLGKLRAQYGLPTYRAHDGLTDALACGELLLAQLAHAGRENVPLAELLRR